MLLFQKKFYALSGTSYIVVTKRRLVTNCNMKIVAVDIIYQNFNI